MNAQINKHSNAYMIQGGAATPLFILNAPNPIKGNHEPVQNYGGDQMKKLGIRIEQDLRAPKEVLGPSTPLIAACYTRFGLIRLSVKKAESGK